MARKASLVKQSILVSACFLLGLYAFLSHTAAPLSSNPSLVLFGESSESESESSTKVKVYMYEDLPSRFTEGIIHDHARARGSPDPSKATYPGHQHMGEWYLYSDLARPQSHRLQSPVVRVQNPEEADLFYVPVFSSLSLIVKPKQQEEYSDEEMQEALVEWLEGQHYWRRSNGRDHVLMASDPNALHRVVDRLSNAVLLLSDFGRLRAHQGSLVKDVIVPYSHRINTYHGDIGLANRNTLLFFMGNRYRKDGGKIRDLLFQMLESEEDVIIKHGTQSRENRRAATHGMHTSKFCLNPAGDTPSACRLFDAIVSLCIPVIVSDSIELPFEDVVDYRKIAVFVGTEAALKPQYLVKLLRGVSDDTILDYQRELREVKRYFEYGDPNGTVNQIWREVAQKVPLIKLMINRDKRLVKRELVEPDCTCLCTNQTGLLNSL